MLYRQSPRKVDRAAARGERQINTELRRQLTCCHLERCSRLRFGDRGMLRQEPCAIHAGESEEIAAGIDDRDVLRDANLARLGDRGIQGDRGALIAELARGPGELAHDAFPLERGGMSGYQLCLSPSVRTSNSSSPSYRGA